MTDLVMTLMMIGHRPSTIDDDQLHTTTAHTPHCTPPSPPAHPPTRPASRTSSRPTLPYPPDHPATIFALDPSPPPPSSPSSPVLSQRPSIGASCPPPPSSPYRPHPSPLLRYRMLHPPAEAVGCAQASAVGGRCRRARARRITAVAPPKRAAIGAGPSSERAGAGGGKGAQRAWTSLSARFGPDVTGDEIYGLRVCVVGG